MTLSRNQKSPYSSLRKKSAVIDLRYSLISMAKRKPTRPASGPVVKLKRLSAATLHKHNANRFNVPTENRFSALSNIGAKKAPEKDAIKQPPPVTITDRDAFPKVDAILQASKLIYRIKYVSIAKKVFLDNYNDRSQIEARLTENDIEFFTHPFAEEKIFKVVLHGLPEIPTDEISKSLIENNNVSPIKISMFETNSSNKIYLVHFNHNEVSKADINKIRVVFNHIVQWRPYRHKKGALTQCYNCGMYGHGANHCHRKASCLLCSRDHVAKNCPFVAVGNQNAQPVYKCTNCIKNKLPNTNHRANDDDCPSRQKYLEFKTKNRSGARSEIKSTVKNNNIRTTTKTKTYTQAPAPPPLRQSFASVMSPTNNSNVNNSHTPTNTNGDDSLWTFEEISNIMLNCLNDLAKCQNKVDQMKVIVNLLQNVCK